jgi:enamine deaminase RidA (YjgF/YER057c/UK114 family)
MFSTDWTRIDGRDFFTVSLIGSADGSVEEETAQIIDEALDIIREEGLDKRHIVRSRLFTDSRTNRQLASDVRRATLVGPLRGSSSSFFDARRLPEDGRVRLDLSVLAPRDPRAVKTIVEYEPAIAPPRYVALDGLVFLSGITDENTGLAAQVFTIRKSIDTSLAMAQTRMAQAKIMSVFLAREEDPREALRLIDQHFADCPVTPVLTQVGGYSSPAKRIEIEITAALP